MPLHLQQPVHLPDWEDIGTMIKLKRRRQSLFPNYKLGVSVPAPKDPEDSELPFGQNNWVKPWNSMQELSKDIYDIYAEYEDDEEERLMSTHSKLSSPAKNYMLNINVGGKVYQISYRVAAKYPKTRIGRLATYTDHNRKLDLCDDYTVQNNEFFFDRDPDIFHNIFNFYRTGVLWIKDELCPRNFLERSTTGVFVSRTPIAAAAFHSRNGKMNSMNSWRYNGNSRQRWKLRSMRTCFRIWLSVIHVSSFGTWWRSPSHRSQPSSWQ